MRLLLASLLSGLSGIHSVCIGCPEEAHAEALKAAYRIIEESDLPCPQNLSVAALGDY
jgi:hypothetical protein